MEFKENLKNLRNARHLSQVELADLLGVSSAAIGMYESGKRFPKHETIELIADFFNVDINYLLGRETKSMYMLEPEIAEIARSVCSDPELAEMIQDVIELDPECRAALKDLVRAIKNSMK